MRDTPVGGHPVLDAHIHFLSHRFLQRLGSLAGFAGDPAARACEQLQWELPPQEPAELAARWVRELDQQGVERAVLIHTLPDDAGSVRAAVEAFPDRLAGYVSVNPADERSCNQAQQALAEWRFRGICLFPSLLHFDLTAEPVRNLFALADQHRAVVFVHCGFLKVAFRTALRLPTAIDPSLANPLLLARHAAEFPQARIVVPHLGSGFLRELLLLADQCPNVLTDTSGMGSWARHLDSAARPVDALKRVLDVLGPHRVLFGSDSSFFPRGWRQEVFQQQVEVFQQAGLDSHQMRRILGSNLEGLLGENGDS